MRLDRAAYSRKYRPTCVEPVKVSTSTSGCSPSALPAMWPWPLTTFSTPSGKPASRPNSAKRKAESGEFSAGLSTTEQPAARAGATFHAAMVRGKFQGTTAPTTPAGSRVMRARASRAVWGISSRILSQASPNHAKVLATALTSMLLASWAGLPISSAMRRASSSAFA